MSKAMSEQKIAIGPHLKFYKEVKHVFTYAAISCAETK
jgi:hypothetical protein